MRKLHYSSVKVVEQQTGTLVQYIKSKSANRVGCPAGAKPASFSQKITEALARHHTTDRMILRENVHVENPAHLSMSDVALQTKVNIFDHCQLLIV